MVEQLLARAAYLRSLRSLERRAQPFGVPLERLAGGSSSVCRASLASYCRRKRAGRGTGSVTTGGL